MFLFPLALAAHVSRTAAGACALYAWTEPLAYVTRIADDVSFEHGRYDAHCGSYAAALFREAGALVQGLRLEAAPAPAADVALRVFARRPAALRLLDCSLALTLGAAPGLRFEGLAGPEGAETLVQHCRLSLAAAGLEGLSGGLGGPDTRVRLAASEVAVDAAVAGDALVLGAELAGLELAESALALALGGAADAALARRVAEARVAGTSVRWEATCTGVLAGLVAEAAGSV